MPKVAVRLKDGRSFCASLQNWRPKEGWFSLVCMETETPERLFFRDVESLADGNRDLLVFARDYGWRGK